LRGDRPSRTVPSRCIALRRAARFSAFAIEASSKETSVRNTHA
jgi:hypothetical protein